MVLVPFQVEPGQYSVFVILQDDNLERIKTYDPAEITLNKMPDPWISMKLKDILIGYASESETADLLACNDEESRQSFLRRLSRGWKFRSERGDHDRSYWRGRT
jgi:hypothetical protein